MRRPRRIVILEGPDGGGKSTLAARIAAEHGWRLAHSGPYPRVKGALARNYVETMLPALLGYEDLVLDRAWPSEPIYGEAFRGGADRLGVTQRRMLDRLALRCDAHVVVCLPGVDACLTAFRHRRGVEMLEREEQLAAVYTAYDDRTTRGALTGLPVCRHDYTRDARTSIALDDAALHPLRSRSGGNLLALIVLVGETLPEPRDEDPLFRAPFTSFSGGGCSAWLAERLEEAGVPETALLWINADDQALVEVLDAAPRRLVIALGKTAEDRLVDVYSKRAKLPLRIVGVDHPQHAKRFHHCEPYELIDLLQKETDLC